MLKEIMTPITLILLLVGLFLVNENSEMRYKQALNKMVKVEQKINTLYDSVKRVEAYAVFTRLQPAMEVMCEDLAIYAFAGVNHQVLEDETLGIVCVFNYGPKMSYFQIQELYETAQERKEYE